MELIKDVKKKCKHPSEWDQNISEYNLVNITYNYLLTHEVEWLTLRLVSPSRLAVVK